jgi:hypothetical protein
VPIERAGGVSRSVMAAAAAAELARRC